MTITDWRNLLISLLDDDYGITRDAYFKLEKMIWEQCSDSGELTGILNATKCSDDRVYLPENWDE